MTDLPPLPKSIFRFAGYGYTIHDTHEYGAACAAAERARVLAWLDAALADTKVCWPGEIDILREQIASGRARGE